MVDMPANTHRKKPARSGLLIGLGLSLLLSAAGLWVGNQWLDRRAGQESQAAAVRLVEQIRQNAEFTREIPAETETPPESSTALPEEDSTQTPALDSASYLGVLTIPRLERLLPVQSSWSPEQLKHSPCRYSGSLTQGELVIAAHNYKTHFGALSTLSRGDAIVFTDLEGGQTAYEVQEICTVAPSDIDSMVESGYDLSLFTCNYGGNARITVRCMKSLP